MRIIALFAIVGISFLLNYVYPMPVILWFGILINIFTCTIFFLDFKKLKEKNEGLDIVSLYYFSIIGGIFGGFLMMAITKFPRRQKSFLILQIGLLIIWVFILTQILQ